MSIETNDTCGILSATSVFFDGNGRVYFLWPKLTAMAALTVAI